MGRFLPMLILYPSVRKYRLSISISHVSRQCYESKLGEISFGPYRMGSAVSGRELGKREVLARRKNTDNLAFPI